MGNANSENYDQSCLNQCWGTFCGGGPSCSTSDGGNPGGYNTCADTCKVDGNKISTPPQSQIIDLGTTTSRIWRIINNRNDTATLYASWTPPNPSNYGIFSPNQYGPFKLSYGQRFELKPGEGQNVKVEIDPAMGAQQARLYMWWDMRGTFYWDSVYDFKFNGGYSQLPAILNLILDD
jgi:hypothetical protein